MKYSLGISNFLEEISSLSHSVVFFYFFALITEEGSVQRITKITLLSLLAVLWNSAFKWVLSFLFFFAFHFSYFLSSKASFLQPSAFFMVQLSYPYLRTGKTIALTIWTFVGKVMSLLFNILSRFVIAFLPRNRHILISWLHSPSAVILKPKKIKSLTVSIVSPSICHDVMGLDPMILVFWVLSFMPAFSLSSFTFIKRLFSSSFCHKSGVICISEVI